MVGFLKTFLRGAMKKACFAFLVIFGFGSCAYAADLPLKAPPPPAPVYNWTGFYIGGNVGGAWTDNRYDYAMPFTTPGNIFAVCAGPPGVGFPASAPSGFTTDCSTQSNIIAGAQIGYNWQMANFVLGVEGDGAWQQLIQNRFVRFGSNPTAGAPMGSVATDTTWFQSQLNALGTFRGRIGYTGGPWLVYATGGLAVANAEHAVTESLAPGVSCAVTPFATCRFGSDSTTKWGWAVGAGIEWMFAPNWSIGAEYLYVDLGSSTETLAPLPVATSPFFPTSSSVTFNDREQVVRVKLNYHFSAPVLANF